MNQKIIEEIRLNSSYELLILSTHHIIISSYHHIIMIITSKITIDSPFDILFDGNGNWNHYQMSLIHWFTSPTQTKQKIITSNICLILCNSINLIAKRIIKCNTKTLGKMPLWICLSLNHEHDEQRWVKWNEMKLKQQMI